MNITILGTGAFGLALSKMFLENDCNITMWTKFDDEAAMLKNDRCHKKVLPDYKIDNSIKFTNNMEEAVKDAHLIVIAIPVKFVRDTIILLSKYYKKRQHICVASKGIEQDSCLFVTNIIKKYIKTKKICVISGGTFAVDMVSSVPMGLTLAGKNSGTINIVKKTLQNKYLRLEVSTDIFGVEMYGAIKNIIAIASGMVDGMNYPESTKCMFITKALNDVMNLIYYYGGNKKTILNYAGIGDLLLTCTSTKSRNYTLGYIIGSGKKQKEIDDYINNTTIEGLYTLKSMYDLIKSKNDDVLIISILYDIIYNHEDKSELVEYLTK